MVSSSHILGWIICVCVVLNPVQTYDKIYEFRHECNHPIKVMEKNFEYLVMYSGETLRSSSCSIAFIAKEDNVPICVNVDDFRISNCNISVQYYRKKGTVDRSFSCNSYPSEFCVNDKDILYIDIKNANLYTDAYIKLEVSSEKKDYTFLIGVGVGVAFVLVCVYCFLRPKIEQCRKNRANAAAHKNSGSQNASSKNQTAPTANAKKPAQKTPQTAAKPAAAKPASAKPDPSKNQQDNKKVTLKPAQQNTIKLSEPLKKENSSNTGNTKTTTENAQPAQSTQHSSSATPKQPDVKDTKPIQQSPNKGATLKQEQTVLQQGESTQPLLPSPEEPQLLLRPLTLEGATIPTMEQNGQSQAAGIQSQVVGVINPLYIPVASVPDYKSLYDIPPPPYKEKE